MSGRFYGKYYHYCYMFFNFEGDRIADFKLEGNRAFRIVYLRPVNLTRAGEKLKNLSTNGTYEAKLKKRNGLGCGFSEGGRKMEAVFLIIDIQAFYLGRGTILDRKFYESYRDRWSEE